MSGYHFDHRVRSAMATAEAQAASERLASEDPYRACEDHCKHDLDTGVLIRSELLAKDGPYQLYSPLVVGYGRPPVTGGHS